jgi:hypothetical protein
MSARTGKQVPPAAIRSTEKSLGRAQQALRDLIKPVFAD